MNVITGARTVIRSPCEKVAVVSQIVDVSNDCMLVALSSAAHFLGFPTQSNTELIGVKLAFYSAVDRVAFPVEPTLFSPVLAPLSGITQERAYGHTLPIPGKTQAFEFIGANFLVKRSDGTGEPNQPPPNNSAHLVRLTAYVDNYLPAR